VTDGDGRDVIVAVANSSRYGGGGGAIATMTMASQAIELFLHEVGHTAFGLADEYDYGTCNNSFEPGEPNVTIQTNRNLLKWADLIAASTPVPTPAGVYPSGTVGLIVGGKYCPSGIYRPTENSRRRTLGFPWHAVNERRIQQVIDQYH